MDLLRGWCEKTVDRYLEMFPAEASRLDSLRQLLALRLPLDDRKTMPGHITASGIIVDLPRGKILLIHHKSLNRWLQPGGHVDPGELPHEGARREILEEVGIDHATLLSPLPDQAMPIDIDSHLIPASVKRGEAAHTHHDFRFLFSVDSTAPLSLALEEVVSAVWMDFEDERLPGDVRSAVGKGITAPKLYPVKGAPP